jgi:hypothetical protein
MSPPDAPMTRRNGEATGHTALDSDGDHDGERPS